jgi:predicted dehydrogenase
MDLMNVRPLLLAGLAAFFAHMLGHWIEAGASDGPIKAGIIGLDAHALAWTKILNDAEAPGELAELTVVAAWPGGSPDIPQSMELLGKSVEPIRRMDVEIVDSIERLIHRVDAVMILSIDGRAHLGQARPVLAAGKPVFIDKPIASSLAEAKEIFRLARASRCPCFSSSALRFAPGTQAVLNDGRVGSVLGCDAFSPCPLEPHHPDFFWYGIHGVETLFTIMGPGCRSVTRIQTVKGELAVGRWDDGRMGTFRGLRAGPHAYGATVFGDRSVVQAGRFEGYEPLLVEIVRFFKTGRPPVSAEQTLEILAFMEAADQSKREGGRAVSIEAVTGRSPAVSTKTR